MRSRRLVVKAIFIGAFGMVVAAGAPAAEDGATLRSESRQPVAESDAGAARTRLQTRTETSVTAINASATTTTTSTAAIGGAPTTQEGTPGEQGHRAVSSSASGIATAGGTRLGAAASADSAAGTRSNGVGIVTATGASTSVLPSGAGARNQPNSQGAVKGPLKP